MKRFITALLLILPMLLSAQYYVTQAGQNVTYGGQYVVADYTYNPVPVQELVLHQYENTVTLTDSTYRDLKGGPGIKILDADFDLTTAYGIPFKTASSFVIGDDTLKACQIFQDDNYEHIRFGKHNEHVVNYLGFETRAACITDVTVYTSALGGTNLTLANNYFGVPKYPTDPVIVTTTIAAAISAASVGDTILIPPGEYVGTGVIAKSVTLQGTGKTIINGEATYAIDINSVAKVTVNNLYLTASSLYVVRVRNNANHTLNKCYFEPLTYWATISSNAGYTYDFNDCVLKGASLVQDNLNVNRCLLASGSNTYIGASADRTININYSKINGSSYGTRLTSKCTVNSTGNTYYVSPINTTALADNIRYSVSMTNDKFYKSGTIVATFNKGGSLYVKNSYFIQTDENTSTAFFTQNMDTVSVDSSFFTAIAGYIYFQATDTTYDINFSNNRVISSSNVSMNFLSQQVGMNLHHSYFEGDNGFSMIFTNTFDTIIADRVYNNEFRYKDQADVAIKFGAIGSTTRLDSSYFDENIFYGPYYFGNYTSIHGVLVEDVQNFRMRNNRFIGASLGTVLKSEGLSMKGTTVTGTIFENCKSGLTVRGCTGTNAYNNTFYSDTITNGYNLVLVTHETEHPSTTDTTTIYNNIMYNALGMNISCDSVGNLSESTLNNNIYYNSGDVSRTEGTDYNLTEWQSTFTQDANSYNVDPNFVDKINFVPQAPEAKGTGVYKGNYNVFNPPFSLPDNSNTVPVSNPPDRGSTKIP